jgi:acyl-homoserine lactone acylase PvdQ
MRHKAIDKIGYLNSSKLHDIETSTFAKNEKYLLVKKIECYYSKTDGIYGFFPSYENPLYDNEINSKENSFNGEFKKDYLDRLKAKVGNDLLIEKINFSNGEHIRNFTVVYDEDSKKISALRFATDKRKISFGKAGELNNKVLTNIYKSDYFIPGFKTSYIQDNNLCYLSFLQVYYENENNLEKYFKVKQVSKLSLFIKEKTKTIKNFSSIFSKFLLLAFIILFPFLFYYYKSQNLYGGEITLTESTHKILDSIKIHTDSHGFFHIKANSNMDAYFALGFLHAKERLWQMDFTRRAARGKLSEIFGMKTVPVDKIMRSLGLNEMSERFENYMKFNSKNIKIFGSYINGINYYANNFILPPEYHFFGAEWKDWELSDSISVSNLMTLTLSHDWNMEVWYKIIEESLGKEFAELVLSYRDVNYPYWDETIVNDEELVELNMHKFRKKENQDKERKIQEVDKVVEKTENEEKIEKDGIDLILENNSEQVSKTGDNASEGELISEIQKDINHIDTDSKQEESEYDQKIQEKEGKTESKSEYKDIENFELPILHNEGASNSWAISGNFTQSGKPILANDPHLTNSMPALFFIAKFYLPDDTITGSTIPGFPHFITGSNRQVSWGFTTENSDVADICEEKIDEDFYLYDGKKYRVSTTKEIINIKGSNPEIMTLKWTRNGPVIPNTLPKQLLVVNFEYKYDIPLSIRFAFYNFEYSGPEFYFALNHAKKTEDFLQLIDKHTAPNLNLLYSTKKGEIGWVPIGRFPVKNYKNRFCRGYTSEDDILGYIPRNEIPYLKNPSKGFIITANNKFASFNYTYNMYGFHNHVRAYRIRELIQKKINEIKSDNNVNKYLTVQDNLEIMKDVKDSLAEKVLPQILRIVERNSQKVGNLKNLKYYEELKNWNFTMTKNSNVPTIYSALELFLGKQLLTNKISDQKARGIMSLLHYWNFISGIVEKIYRGERVDLKQCAHLSGNINCEKYIVYIFNNLDKFISETGLKDKNGKVLNWGEVKHNHYPHSPFEMVPVLNKLYSRNVYTGGNRNTVKIARGPFNHDIGQFVSTHSPRFKFICDMNDPTRPYIIMDAGNSGNVMSKFYDNLMHKHENSELVQYEDVDFDTLTFPSADNILIRNK